MDQSSFTVDRNRPATVVPIGDEFNRKCYRSVMLSVAQQWSREFSPTVPTTRMSDGEVQGRKDPTEIRQRPCLDPQQLQPTTSAMSTAVISSRRTVLPPWPSGVNLRPEINRLRGSKTCPRLSDSARNRLRCVMSFCELKLDVIRSRAPFSTVSYARLAKLEPA